MIKWIVLIIVMVIVGVIGAIGTFLGPDDLKGCADGPAASGNCQAADAIIAVSGGDTNARTDEAIRLYKLGWASSVIFSGAAQDTSGPSNAQAMRTRALDQGVPDSAITIEEFSRNTAENAANTAALVVQHGLHRVILVTSGYHQRRASLEFASKLGPSVTIVNHPVVVDRQWGPNWWLTPHGWWLAISELIKIIASGGGEELTP